LHRAAIGASFCAISGRSEDRRRPTAGRGLIEAMTAANRWRMRILYSGHVQGVGFRYTAKATARGFDVTGTVRNLPDGRVELVAEGTREELEDFRRAIRQAGLEHFIRHEAVTWDAAQGGLRGFEIVG